MAPGQVFAVAEWNEQVKYEGWSLWFHPDLITSSSLGIKIREYTFFSYLVSEALHLSEDEKNTLKIIVEHIQKNTVLVLINIVKGLSLLQLNSC